MSMHIFIVQFKSEHSVEFEVEDACTVGWLKEQIAASQIGVPVEEQTLIIHGAAPAPRPHRARGLVGVAGSPNGGKPHLSERYAGLARGAQGKSCGWSRR